MSYEPEPIDRVLLWRLAVSGGGEWLKEIKPAPNTNVRNRLKKAGFIEEEKRKPASGGRAMIHLSIAERGWNELSENPTALLSTQSNTTAILQKLLVILDHHLRSNALTVAEFIHAAGSSDVATERNGAPASRTEMRPPSPQRDGSPVAAESLPRRIAEAYARVSGGEQNVRVRLADLREALPDIPRDRLDAALLELAIHGDVALYQLDNPAEIHQRDRDATLYTPAGDPRHIIYLGGRGK